MKYQIISTRHVRKNVVIVSTKDIYNLVKRYARLKQETFIVITLTTNMHVISMNIISLGLLDRSLAHPREVFRSAFLDNAHSIIIAHNHPSGNVEPSAQDHHLYAKLLEASKTLGIPIFDNVIFTNNDFVSFRDKKYV